MRLTLPKFNRSSVLDMLGTLTPTRPFLDSEHNPADFLRAHLQLARTFDQSGRYTEFNNVVEICVSWVYATRRSGPSRQTVCARFNSLTERTLVTLCQ